MVNLRIFITNVFYFSTNMICFLQQEEYEPPRYFRMIHENQPECGFIVLGIMASCVAGCTMPAFAIFFGEMIKVTEQFPG